MSIGKNVGREQNGSGRDFERPVLIIKKWNNEMVWGVPLSTKQKNRISTTILPIYSAERFP